MSADTARATTVFAIALQEAGACGQGVDQTEVELIVNVHGLRVSRVSTSATAVTAEQGLRTCRRVQATKEMLQTLA